MRLPLHFQTPSYAPPPPPHFLATPHLMHDLYHHTSPYIVVLRNCWYVFFCHRYRLSVPLSISPPISIYTYRYLEFCLSSCSRLPLPLSPPTSFLFSPLASPPHFLANPCQSFAPCRSSLACPGSAPVPVHFNDLCLFLWGLFWEIWGFLWGLFFTNSFLKNRPK